MASAQLHEWMRIDFSEPPKPLLVFILAQERLFEAPLA